MRPVKSPKPPNKQAYESPRAEISKTPNDDIITYSSSNIGKWDPQDIVLKYNF